MNLPEDTEIARIKAELAALDERQADIDARLDNVLQGSRRLAENAGREDENLQRAADELAKINSELRRIGSNDSKIQRVVDVMSELDMLNTELIGILDGDIIGPDQQIRIEEIVERTKLLNKILATPNVPPIVEGEVLSRDDGGRKPEQAALERGRRTPREAAEDRQDRPLE